MRDTWFASLAILVLAISTILLPLMIFTPIARAASVPYNSGDPTPHEQLVLEYINRARANPIAEGQRLGIDIHEGLSDPTVLGARPPLAMNPILLDTATAHTLDMYNHNYFSHNDPNGTTPFDRMVHAGYNYAMAGENMAGGVDMASSQLEDFMMIDSGTPGRPHRVNLLDIFPYPCGTPPCIYSEVGIGYLNAPTPDGQGLSSLITEDFGATSYTGPFLLGVVYNDQNGNNFYDIGEGISGVTITPNTGTYYAISSTSGGYAIPIGSSGTITVTASGPGFGPITKTVTLTGTNIKLDFTTSSQITTTSTSIQATSTLVTTTSQTTTSILTVPSITINPISATTGSIIDVTGSGFSTADVTCTLSGKAVGTSTCAISNGIVTASYIVANVPIGPYTITASGIEAGDSASSTFTVSTLLTQTTTTRSTYTNETSKSTTYGSTNSTTTITQSSTNITSTTKTADFLLISSAPTITMTQGGSGSATITIYSLNGFSSTITLTSSWIGNAPAGVLVSITSPVTPVSGEAATSPLIVTANITAAPGAYVIQVAGTSASQSHIVTVNIIVQAFQPVNTSSTTITSATSATSMTSMTSTSLTLPSSCPVSYAVSGSELAPLAEELRIFRDHSITKTRSGLAFMILFNSWYYSLTPHLTSYLRLHSAQRELFRYGLYPLIAILYVSRYAYLFVSPVSVEGGAMTAGIIAASLLGLVYIAPIAYAVIRVIRRYMKFSTLSKTGMSLWCSFGVPIVGAAYFMTQQLLGLAIANLLLSMLTLCVILGIQALSHLQLKCNSFLRTRGIVTFAISVSDVLVETLTHFT